MTYFTTEMVFIHPPRQHNGHYAGTRRLRYGCRTQAVSPTQTHDDVRPQTDTADAPADAAATASAGIDLAA